MNVSFEGLLGLVGTALITAAFPVLLFGDEFDPSRRPTQAELVAAFLTGLGLVAIAIPFIVIASKLIWTTIFGR